MTGSPGAEEQCRIKEQWEAATAHVEGNQQKRRQQHHAEKGVHQPGQAGSGPADSPQEIVEEAQSRSGGSGLKKLGNLKEDRLFHIQPNSRAKNPPPVGCSSS